MRSLENEYSIRKTVKSKTTFKHRQFLYLLYDMISVWESYLDDLTRLHKVDFVMIQGFFSVM